MSDVPMAVVIVAHNSLAELRRSLPALLSQLQPEDELIIVDNASSDGLADQLSRLAPTARLLVMDRNVGFAAGANAGAADAHADLLVFLNPDAIVERGWGAAIRRPWGGSAAAWMGLVLLEDGEHINTSGGVLHFTGFGWAGQVGEPASAGPATSLEVGFLSGACLAIPRDLWQGLGGFPEHFFMYCEDVDLSLRLRLLGGRLLVAPDARVDHVYEFAKGEQKWRRLERNRWATLLRTYPAPLLALVMPALLATEVAVWVVAVRGRWGRAKAWATVDVLRALPSLLRERRIIQAAARVPASAFASSLTATLDSPYFGRVGRHPVVRHACGVYWRCVVNVLPRLDASGGKSQPRSPTGLRRSPRHGRRRLPPIRTSRSSREARWREAKTSRDRPS
jgi:N-acetylglucosaminyl-diphospho-decaprenol L-rhamnosyltransferase